MRTLLVALALLAAPLAQAQEETAEIVPPVLVQDVVPDYPEEARAQGLTGRVVVEIAVGEEGLVHDAEVVESAHPLLDLLSLEAARKLRFEPATVEGEPVAVSLHYRFQFDLDLSDEQGTAVPGSLYGVVYDPDGQPIEGVTVKVLSMTDPDLEPILLATKADGSFKATFLPSGDYLVRLVSDRYDQVDSDLTLRAGENLQRSFTLLPTGSYEVVVTYDTTTWREVERAERQPDEGTVTGTYTLTRRDMELTPGTLEDVSRAVHVLPGVVADGDMFAAFHTRGGDTEDVVFMLDRVPLQNPYHLAGFNSLFNPDMISEVAFFAGAAPAQVPAGTSAVMAVETWDGTPRQDGGGIDGAIDISASSLRALVMGPVSDEVTVALAARRSYLESYMQVMKWANIVDTAFAAPEYSEVSARVAWRPHRDHRIIASWMNAGDSMALVDSTDDSLIAFDGTFELRNTLGLVSLDHTWTPSDRVELRSTTAWTRDRSILDRDFGGVFSSDAISHRYFGRTDLSYTSERHEAAAGVDLSYHFVRATGTVEDPRSEPTWHNAPMAEYDRPTMDVDTDLTYPEFSAYVQETWKGPVRVRGGVRATYMGLTEELLLSPRAGLSIPLPTGTVPKASWGIYHSAPRDALVYDPEVGGEDIVSETAMHWVVGIDQGFPLPGEEAGGLLRVEAWQIDLDHLLVNPDTYEAVQAGQSWASVGTGRSRGVDSMVAARAGRFQAMASYSYLQTERTNPLNELWPQTTAPLQDQRHTLASTLEYQLTPRWRLTTRYAYHSGRPVSTVQPTGDEGKVELSCLNCERLGPTHQLDLRAEWRKAMEKYRLSFYAEVLNITNFQSDFVPTASVVDGELEMGMFSHLPIRPFLGVRADF